MMLFSEKKESIVDVAVVLGRFEVRGAVRNPGFFMVAEENICKGGTEWEAHTYSFSLGVVLSIKDKKGVHDTQLKEGVFEEVSGETSQIIAVSKKSIQANTNGFLERDVGKQTLHIKTNHVVLVSVRDR